MNQSKHEMNSPGRKCKDLPGWLLIIGGILAIVIVLAFTPSFVARYILSDHSITSGGIDLLDRYRSYLGFTGILSLLFGFHLLLEGKLKSNPKSWEHLVFCLTVLIVSIGFFLRIYFYAVNRSLWIDEAMLSLNIVNRSLAGMFAPLELNQGAPIGFLLAEKLVTLILGSKDYILRLIPLISGLISIPLVILISKKYCSRFTGFIALFFFVFSSRLIYYSSEVKQYSSDVLATLLLLLVAPRIFEEKNRSGSFILVGSLGIITLFFSHPSVFVFSGVLITAGIFFLVQKDWKGFYWLLGIGLLWILAFSLDYFINLRFSASNPYLYNYWKGSYAPFPPWDDIRWYGSAIIGMLKDPAVLPANLVTIGFLALGIISIALKRWWNLLLLFLPFLITLIASTFQKYPFSGRLILFLVPSIFIFLAEGMERFRKLVTHINPHVAWFLTSFLALYFISGPVSVAYSNVINPPMGQDIRPVMEYVGNHEISSDKFYVYHGALPAYRFYAPSIDRLNDDYIVGTESIYQPEKYLQQIDQIGYGKRVWFIFSNNCSGCKVNEQEYILEYIDSRGTKLDQYEAIGASAYLYLLGN